MYLGGGHNAMRDTAQATAKENLWIDGEAGTERARLKIWEMDNCFKCPIVGTCVTLAEQKHLLKKAGVCLKKKSPFDIHEVLVASCEGENRLSRKFDAMLERKFRKKSVPLFEMDNEVFMAHWNERFPSGDFEAALWAAACRRDLSTEQRREVFGMVHMAMHWNSRERAASLAKLSIVEKEQAELRERFKESASDRKALEKRCKELEAENRSLQADLASTLKKNKALAGQGSIEAREGRIVELERMVSNLQQERAELSRTVAKQNRRIEAMTEERLRQSEVNDRLAVVDEELRESLGETLRTMRRIDSCDEKCPDFDLCRKRVLIVGGIARMESLYRRMIENSGGRLEYHDGNLNGGAKQLESRLMRADIVLCPVNCNSHAACSLVKNLGKKHRKPVHMMPNFSLSAVSRVIGEKGGVNSAGI
jgi:hypothetical protein